jgi:hypothetical protein
MPAVTSAFAATLSTQYQTFLVNVGKSYPRLWPVWFKSMDMETNPYISDKISGVGSEPVKPEGQQFVPVLPTLGSSFQVTATPYGFLFSVTWEMWRDDKYGVMGEMWSSMARNNRTRQEVQAFSLINNGFSVNTGYDNATLFNTAHVNIGDQAVQANRPSPDVTLSQLAIQAGMTNFDGLNDENSLPISVTATRLLIHQTNRYLARELLGSSGKPGTANNDTNALPADGLQWGVSRFLLRTQDWVLMAPIEEVDLEFMWRDRPRSRTFDDPFIEASDHTVYQRFATRAGDYRGVYGSSVGF